MDDASNSETRNPPNLFMSESHSDSSSLISSLNNFLEDNENINIPLESSMEPRSDLAPDPNLVIPTFDENIMHIGNISSVIQDPVGIPDNSLEIDEDLRKFIQNSNLGQLDSSKQGYTKDHKVSFRLNELEWPKVGNEDLVQDLTEFPLDENFCSTVKIKEGYILHREAIRRQKLLLCKYPVTLVNFISPL